MWSKGIHFHLTPQGQFVHTFIVCNILYFIKRKAGSMQQSRFTLF
ncbi:hypothetical protein PALI_b0215 [Pseudoalteromonas aliena SW19]|uniref:Uncharacterized protein n=1 Tax=Pseudoalteromonas aliena SW19 TaxID=1314866 RepID=A0ABR9E3T2_9GAMM|nr:hypothetical protein [Pseudoalteromonas aliena SW19]